MTRRKLDAEFQRRRRNFIIDQVRCAIRGIRISEGRVARSSRDRWEFTYRMFVWSGPATGANDAAAKGWAAFLGQQGVPGYAQPVVAAPTEFAFVA